MTWYWRLYIAAVAILIALAIWSPARAAQDGAVGRILVTGYTGKGLTASGVLAAPGVAACPSWVPFGTLVWLDGVGTVRCADRYAAWLGPRVDVWVPTVAEAYALTGLREWTPLWMPL